MGVFNDVFNQNKISFSNIEEFLQILLKQNKNASNNKSTLYEIGLLKEYSNIKSNKISKELFYISTKNKSIKSFINSEKIILNFVEWTKYFFDINTDNLDSEFNQIIEKLKETLLNKEFFRNNMKKYLFTNKSFNNKLLNNGIPHNFREFIWDLAIGVNYRNGKYFNLEEEQKEYNSILKNIKFNTQIEKDLNRTFIHESEKTKKNIQKLKNVLNCIHHINQEYCQGMNFIVGFLLKLTNYDEVKTLYIIKNILIDIKGYFEDEFPLLKKNINIFEKYLQELFPKLYNHFKKCEVYSEFWVGKWLQTLFTLSLPFEELCNVWDILIIKGFDYILYISLALINSIENELLKLEDSSDILAYIKNALYPKETTTINKKELEDKTYMIIPLNQVLDKANEIEKKIKENNYHFYTENRRSGKMVNKISSILEKETNNDLESFSTKENENSIKHSSSSKSTLFSSYTENSNILESPNLIKSQQNINNLKNNLCNVEFGLDKNNNSSNKKPTYYSSKTVKPFNERNNIGKLRENLNLNSKYDISKLNPRGSLNLNNNNFNLNNIKISYNTNTHYPIQNGQYLYYLNNNMNYNIVDNRVQYTNFVVYYA